MTDLGRVRTNNEDCFRIVEPLNLFVLSDGMGGEAHGEVASELAVETIVKFCMDPQADAGGALLSNTEPSWSEKTRRLTSAVHLANKNIYEAAEAHPEQHGMGATLTATCSRGETIRSRAR
jgi:protein phosphatase